MKSILANFWSLSPEEVIRQLNSNKETGLSIEELTWKMKEEGAAQRVARSYRFAELSLLLSQFKTPFMVLLLASDGLSFFLGEHLDALIILVIILLSALLSFFQEKGAKDTIEKLLELVKVRATVLRGGKQDDILIEEVVKGDIIILRAGDVIPADCLLLESKDLYLSESILTGESFPVYKNPESVSATASINERSNVVFKGTHVSSGYAKAIAVITGSDTEFGKLQSKLNHGKTETEFERGLKRFSYLLMQIAVILTFIIFAINIYFGKPFIESLLFSLSLSIGVTPFLLPAIVSVNLAFGAKHMALKKVIVKRLVSIENFGSMNVFCSDKTGTLTSGEMQIHSFVNVSGVEDQQVLEYAYVNASLQSGFQNPIDETIIKHDYVNLNEYVKVDEQPYDFVRKLLSVLVRKNGSSILIVKGAFNNVLDRCKYVSMDGKEKDIQSYIPTIQKQFEEFSAKGFRIIAIASKKQVDEIKEDELTYMGMLLFHDPVKDGVIEAVDRMKRMGITLKVLTGDNRKVTSYVAGELNINTSSILTGSDLNQLNDEALKIKVNQTDVFAELEPNQKERIVRLLSKSGNVVGYIGDGINDISAIHAADVAISVNNAVDVAKSAADIILLEKDLNVLTDGVLEGRRTFLNTIKYIFMTSSANFGNIISMSFMSLFLPYLPLLPKQVLASNFLTDFPAMTIPSDNVDESWLSNPKKWDLSFIKKFMIWFGLLSSIFDFITFGILILILKSTPEEFRSGWFMVTIFTEFVVLYVLRSKNVFYKSKPGKLLFLSTTFMFILTFFLPYSFLGDVLELKPIPIDHIAWVIAIVVLYAMANEFLKRIFYKKVNL